MRKMIAIAMVTMAGGSLPTLAQQPASFLEEISKSKWCQAGTQLCEYKVGGGRVVVGYGQSGVTMSVAGNITGYLVTLVSGCVSIQRMSDKNGVTVTPSNGNVADSAEPCLRQRASSPAVRETPGRALSPCERPRPYKNWSNAELSAALVRYMDSTDKATLQALIDESACRK